MQNFGAWQSNFEYIATNPQVLGGKPIIKGTRISVEFILELVASGASVKDIVAAYPDLPEEAVKEAMRDQRVNSTVLFPRLIIRLFRQ
ncbi:MAG: DUF433 domain-containing protein [Haliscomenobacter sp.]|nr:DUF433 domain-containing protein [Haliscomenobacter sp.]